MNDTFKHLGSAAEGMGCVGGLWLCSELYLERCTAVHSPAPLQPEHSVGCCLPLGRGGFPRSLLALSCRYYWPSILFCEPQWFSWKWDINTLCVWGPTVRRTVIQKCLELSVVEVSARKINLLCSEVSSFLSLPNMWTGNSFWLSELLLWRVSSSKEPCGSHTMCWVLVQASYDKLMLLSLVYTWQLLGIRYDFHVQPCIWFVLIKLFETRGLFNLPRPKIGHLFNQRKQKLEVQEPIAVWVGCFHQRRWVMKTASAIWF